MPRRALTAALAAFVASAALSPVVATARAQDEPKAAEKAKGKKGDKAKGANKADISDTARLAKRASKANEVAARFWDQQAPLELVLTTDVKRIKGDKSDKAPWRAATLSYRGPNGDTVAVPLQIRTRGIWRLKHCKFPPLRLNFGEKEAKGTVFEGIDKPKMVSVCGNDDGSERYVLQEFQLYRVQNALTPASHKVRLARVTYTNTDGKPEMVRWAFLIEEPEAMAARMRGQIVEQEGARSTDLEPRASALAGVFQYLIGNTDFSVSNLHNVELVRVGYGVHVPVPYDFDYAGAVNAWYAKPPSQLNIKSVTDRVFRGECTPVEDLTTAVSLVHSKKDDIYALYADPLGKLLPAGLSKETLSYFDAFFRETADPRGVQRMADACLGKP